ncbi:MAG: hypothetical protein LBT00_11895 [Spirochaetaceae bacterium]|nr:hypothetical protein [Spirochaetaceae bacterium]
MRAGLVKAGKPPVIASGPLFERAKQSRGNDPRLDCFTNGKLPRVRNDDAARHCERASLKRAARHCEERSDEAIQGGNILMSCLPRR